MAIDPSTHPRCVFYETTIHAPIEKVWSTLADFSRYSEWNPFTYGVSCDKIVGHEVILKVNLGKGKLTMHERLARWEEGSAFAWGVRWGGGFLLASDRVQYVKKVDNTTTIYGAYEAFDGFLASIVNRFYGEKVLEGCRSNALALKARCEKV